MPWRVVYVCCLTNGLTVFPQLTKNCFLMCLTILLAFASLILIEHVKFSIFSGLIKLLVWCRPEKTSLAQAFFLIKICVQKKKKSSFSYFYSYIQTKIALLCSLRRFKFLYEFFYYFCKKKKSVEKVREFHISLFFFSKVVQP